MRDDDMHDDGMRNDGMRNDGMRDGIDKEISPFNDAFGFTDKDLDANRAKRLSWRQRRRLSSQWLGTLVSTLLLAIVPILLTWSIVAYATDVTVIGAASASESLIGYVVGGLLGILFALVNHKTLMLGWDLLIGRVRSLRGVAQIHGRYLIIGKRRFLLDEDALKMVQSKLRYRVFVLPASSTLLSIEFAD